MYLKEEGSVLEGGKSRDLPGDIYLFILSKRNFALLCLDVQGAAEWESSWFTDWHSLACPQFLQHARQDSPTDQHTAIVWNCALRVPKCFADSNSASVPRGTRLVDTVGTHKEKVDFKKTM